MATAGAPPFLAKAMRRFPPKNPPDRLLVFQKSRSRNEFRREHAGVRRPELHPGGRTGEHCHREHAGVRELCPGGRTGKRRRRRHAGVRELHPGLDLFTHNHSEGTRSLDPSKHRATHQQER